ncbi:MAG: SDR family NAD(P)-dependent oxidoreductase [Thermosulfidibacteraceae bacterium]|jgi:NAD(P)-dependent dehydrogenase (short-subunit alcohol dehydrogenase family)
MDPKILSNKIAIVTGGYRGIGEAFTRAYAKNGAIVAICGRSLEEASKKAENLSKDYNTSVIAYKVDVSKKEEVKKMVEDVAKRFGRIDILVNCAGTSGVQKPFWEIEDEEFDKVFDTNFRGALYFSREVANYMIKQRSGKIINVASIAGKLVLKYMMPYCISKVALIHLTKVMALELMKYNIQVNVVSPGYFLTDMNRFFFETEQGKNFIEKYIPIKRVGMPEEIETTAIYLALAPEFLTGCEIVIDGGQTLI